MSLERASEPGMSLESLAVARGRTSCLRRNNWRPAREPRSTHIPRGSFGSMRPFLSASSSCWTASATLSFQDHIARTRPTERLTEELSQCTLFLSSRLSNYAAKRDHVPLSPPQVVPCRLPLFDTRHGVVISPVMSTIASEERCAPGGRGDTWGGLATVIEAHDEEWSANELQRQLIQREIRGAVWVVPDRGPRGNSTCRSTRSTRS